MKYLLMIALLSFTYCANSQELPRKSSFATVEQRVGLNDLKIEYSRPNVNGRVIFGDVVPFGEVWRLGANQATTIELTYPIEINGNQLDTGLYAVFAVPHKNYWEIVFNTNSGQWGSNEYNEKDNVLEYHAAVVECDFSESFQISFINVNENSAVLLIEWSNNSVRIPFTTNTIKAVEDGIEAKIVEGEDLARVYFNAADYYFDNNEIEKAKLSLEKSLSIEKSYYNLFLKAQMLKEENKEEAVKLAKEAVKMAEKADKKGWASYITRKSSEW